MLIGDRVRLRAVEPADYPHIARWLNDAQVMFYWGRPGNTVAVAEVARLDQAEAARGNSQKYVIEVEDRAIGQIDYYDLDWRVRSAWVSVLIGDKDYWSGGYGTDAMRTLLRYLFDQLGLHRVTLTVHETNARAQRSYEKNGFVREGLLRDWAYFDGHWENGVVMGVLAQDFRDKVGSPMRSVP
jgi:RimJ/RimL family protein N-acetyltransferase